eukprot:sb/3472847/
MCAWLEKDSTITTTAIKTLHRIIQDELDDADNKDTERQEGSAAQHGTNGQHNGANGQQNGANGQQNGANGQQNGADQNGEQEGGEENNNIDQLPGPAAAGLEANRQPVAGELPPPGDTPKTADKLRVTPRTPVQLVTPTYGTPCGAVPTPSSKYVGQTPI